MKNILLITFLATIYTFSACAATAKTNDLVEAKPTKTIEKIEPIPTPTQTVNLTISKTKPSLIKLKNAKIKLGYGKKAAVVDLENTDDVTLGGESNHQFKLFFATVKDDQIYYLFEVQSGSPMSDKNAPCGGDSPQTLVWLQTDLNLKIEQAKSEIFASCAFNGGRYLQGKVNSSSHDLRIVFQEQLRKNEIFYDNSTPEKGFEIKELK